MTGAAPPSPPVWVLLGEKAGDNAQCRALAEAVAARGPAVAEKRLGADPLAPPWPALVIACGRRGERAALALRARAAAEGARVRLVQIGRPLPPLGAFDLVLAAPQFELPPLANVLPLALPLHRLPPDAAAAWARAWEPPGAPLPRPWIALLVGGSARPYVLGAEAARAVARHASRAAREAGGALLVTTSRRTPAAAVDALVAALDAPHFVHRWSDAAGAAAACNPYPAFLARADRFLVTGDSASMLCEAVATGRPVEIFAPAARLGTAERLRAALRRAAVRAQAPGGGPLRALVRRAVVSIAPRPPRDLRRLHAALVARGFATRAGAAPPPPPEPGLPAAALLEAELARAAEGVRSLLEDREPPRPRRT